MAKERGPRVSRSLVCFGTGRDASRGGGRGKEEESYVNPRLLQIQMEGKSARSPVGISYRLWLSQREKEAVTATGLQHIPVRDFHSPQKKKLERMCAV